jgi:transposase
VAGGRKVTEHDHQRSHVAGFTPFRMEVLMEVIYPKCAGLDVHKNSVVACVRLASGQEVVRHIATFETTTSALLNLGEWLTSHGVTHVAMEATGVYWKPVWHALSGSALPPELTEGEVKEDSFQLVLVNAAHIKKVKGRKTDVSDAQWIAELLAHGLVQGSFVPPTHVQDLRVLTRTRKQLSRERTQHVQRIQKTLEDANIKLSSVVSDVTGMSARAILEALANGETDPEKLVELVTTRIHASRATVLEALRGNVRKPHRFLLRLHLDQLKAIDDAIDKVDVEVGECLEPFRQATELLTTMPGVGDVVAQSIVSEIGTDMMRFPSAAHLVSWAALCPGQDESAGKQRSRRTRKGPVWLKTMLVQAAWAAIRMKNKYPNALFHRIKRRGGPKKAIIAVAASMLRAIYFMLRDGVPYRDLGPDHFARADRDKTAKRLIKRLADLGVQVEIKEAA